MIAARRALQATRGYATAAHIEIPAVIHGIEGRYATALYTAAAKKQALDAVETDLKQVKRVVEKDTKLREFLENPTINRIEKKSGVQQMLAAGKYNELTKNFFDTLAENGRLYDTVKIINSYGSLMSAYRGEVQVTITSAKELDAKEVAKVKGFLAKSAFVTPKQTLIVQNKVNPSILGGLVVEFGDKTIDLSVSSKINKLNQLLHDLQNRKMDDIRLEDEPFAPFDDYEDYADEMMQEAERQDQLMMQSSHQQQPAASGSALPPQRDFLAILNEQNQRAEQQAQAQAAQQRPASATTWQKKKAGAKGSRPIGSAASGAAVDEDLAAVNTAKKRVKIIRLDAEKLMSEKGFPLLINNGKRLKIRQKYKDTAEKQANAKQNLEDLMRLYQTWAHNLFPKATFRDFIVQAENKCKTKHLKQVMDGWRDAHWQQVFEKKQAAWEEERSEQTATEQQNNVWAEHENELATSASATFGTTITLNGSGSAGQSDHGDPSTSSSSSAKPTHPLFTGANPSSAAQRPKPRPAASRKGKEKAIDNPSAAMRLVASDDEEDDQQDYSAVMDRMRVSMNINDTMDEDLQDPSANEARRISSNGGSFNKRALEQDDDDDDEEQTESRRNEIDLDNYDSEVEDDDDGEDEDGEQPLFTHRALKMMGGLEALEARNKSTVSADRQPEVAKTATEPHQARGDVSLSEEETSMELEDLEAPVELKLSFAMGSQEKDTNSGGANVQQGEEDEEGLLAVRKPGRTRRLILMDDSDDE
ncbi:ATP synthase F0 subcomplex subunit OSCP atp5 [Mortierella alpina]|nr:ATP synthase F0 subcomplex subunit OSCP atp5 [Mortierella alpina]